MGETKVEAGAAKGVSAEWNFDFSQILEQRYAEHWLLKIKFAREDLHFAADAHRRQDWAGFLTEVRKAKENLDWLVAAFDDALARDSETRTAESISRHMTLAKLAKYPLPKKKPKKALKKDETKSEPQADEFPPWEDGPAIDE